jgi:ABC-2 type transport system permease protein
MFSIYIKEVNSYLDSLIAYIVIGVFLTAIGLLMWVFPETSVLQYGFADMTTLFSLGPYVFMFLIPAITMRTFAEEKKAGTIELLMTRPLTDWDIILGKYLSACTLVLFAIFPTLIYFFSLYYLGNPQGNLDIAGISGSYIGLFLLGALFTSIGILASSLTENQIIAFVIAVFFCFIFYTGFASFASINVWSAASLFIEQWGILYHYSSMSKGLVDSRDLIYFFSVIFIMLLFAHLNLGSRKW